MPGPDPSLLPSLAEINKGLEAFSAAGTASADAAVQVGRAIDQAESSGAVSIEALLGVIVLGAASTLPGLATIMRSACAIAPEFLRNINLCCWHG
jgi:hypothetical protein